MNNILKTLSAGFGIKSAEDSESSPFIPLHAVGNIVGYLGANNRTGIEDKAKGYIRKGYAANADLFAVIDRITKFASNVPFTVYEVKDNAAMKHYKPFAKEGSFSAKRVDMMHKALEPVEGTSINTLLEEPCEGMTWTEWVEQAIGFKLLTGETFIYGLVPAGRTNPYYFTQMYLIPPQGVKMEHTNRSKLLPEFRYLPVDESAFNEFEAENMIHWKTWNPDIDDVDWMRGMSPIRAALNVLSRSNNAQTAARSAYQNMGAYGMITSDSNEFVDPEIMKRMKESYKRIYGGSENAKDVLTTNARLRWVNFGMSPVDLAIIDSMNMDMKQFCNLYGFPIVLMNSEKSSTYNNVTESKKSAYTDAVLPPLNGLRDKLNNTVVRAHNEVSGKNYWIDYDISSIPVFQDDYEKMSDRKIKEVEIGLISRNEARMVLNYGESEIEGMEVPTVSQSGTTRIDRLGENNNSQNA